MQVYTREWTRTYVTIRQNDEIVALDIHEGEDKEPPAVFYDDSPPFLEAVLVEGIRCVDYVEEDVVEEGLEGGYRCTLFREQRR